MRIATSIVLVGALLNVTCSVPTKVFVTNNSSIPIAILQSQDWLPIPVDGSKTVLLGMRGGQIRVRAHSEVLTYEIDTGSLLDSPFRECVWGACFHARIDEAFNVILLAPDLDPQPDQPSGFPLVPKREKNAA